MRVRFDEIFHINAAGSVCAKVPVVIGGVRIDPGMEFGRRVRLGTVHFAGIAHRDLEVEQQAGVTYVMRPYSHAPGERHHAPGERPPPPQRRPVSILLESLT